MCVCVCIYIYIGFLRQGFSVALEPVPELVLVDQACLKLTKICLPLPPEFWDYRREPPLPNLVLLFYCTLG